MPIFNDEQQLFARWRVTRPGMIPDGVADEPTFLASKPKILFVLKEPNDPARRTWDLRQFLRDGARGPTWNPITRWTRGIRRLPALTLWKDVEWVSRADRIAILRSIAAMNLKKEPGGPSAANQAVAAVALADSAFLADQFALYDADVAVCCGAGVAKLVPDVCRLNVSRGWTETTRGVEYLEYKTGKFLFSYLHPQVQWSQNLLFYGLVDAVKEVRHPPTP